MSLYHSTRAMAGARDRDSSALRPEQSFQCREWEGAGASSGSDASGSLCSAGNRFLLFFEGAELTPRGDAGVRRSIERIYPGCAAKRTPTASTGPLEHAPAVAILACACLSYAPFARTLVALSLPVCTAPATATPAAPRAPPRRLRACAHAHARTGAEKAAGVCRGHPVAPHSARPAGGEPRH